MCGSKMRGWHSRSVVAVKGVGWRVGLPELAGRVRLEAKRQSASKDFKKSRGGIAGDRKYRRSRNGTGET